MLVTPEGRLTDTKLLQELNALRPMLVRPDGRITPLMLVLPKKADSPMLLTGTPSMRVGIFSKDVVPV